MVRLYRPTDRPLPPDTTLRHGTDLPVDADDESLVRLPTRDPGHYPPARNRPPLSADDELLVRLSTRELDTILQRRFRPPFAADDEA
ncbi:hypothetical protein K449DRAFT_391945 [Hypoxylon sp. EC38]|nr:hypothetical protein K449DRAFT_391945 [Hypoxylon sp. EC38]